MTRVLGVVAVATLVFASAALFAQKPREVSLKSKGGAVNPQASHQPWSASGAFSGIREARQMVARDQKAFEALWKKHQPNGGTPVPTVDFKKYDVVAVFGGSRNTGGFSVELGEIERKGKTATVHATVYKPGPGAMVFQAFTYPFAMSAVPKLPADVRFVVKEAVKTEK